MQIIVNTGKANIASADLLALSRTIRNLREEVEDVRRQLRQHTQLDSCRAELRKQEEALSLLTARLVNLSSALRQISDAYSRAERQNVDRLEEEGAHHQAAGVTIYEAGSYYRDKFHQILYQ